MALTGSGACAGGELAGLLLRGSLVLSFHWFLCSRCLLSNLCLCPLSAAKPQTASAAALQSTAHLLNLSTCYLCTDGYKTLQATPLPFQFWMTLNFTFLPHTALNESYPACPSPQKLLNRLKTICPRQPELASRARLALSRGPTLRPCANLL